MAGDPALSYRHRRRPRRCRLREALVVVAVGSAIVAADVCRQVSFLQPRSFRADASHARRVSWVCSGGMQQQGMSMLRRDGGAFGRAAGRMALPAAARSDAGEPRREQILEGWYVMKDGRFRGTLLDGLIVEFEGRLLGPQDPGVVVGPGGMRYVLGEAARNAATAQPWQDKPQSGFLPEGTLQIAVAAASAAAAAIIIVLGVTGMLQKPADSASPSAGPVTRTNVTIVETRKTMPDGSQARIIDRTTRRERTVPGKSPVVTEKITRTEKVLRDERVAALPTLVVVLVPELPAPPAP